MFVSLCRLPDRLSGLLLDYLPCRLLDRRPGRQSQRVPIARDQANTYAPITIRRRP